jgi:hypothetical protein
MNLSCLQEDKLMDRYRLVFYEGVVLMMSSFSVEGKRMTFVFYLICRNKFQRQLGG